MNTSPENACAALGYVVGTAADNERIIAVDILMDALMGSNEAPLKKALLEAGFAGDVFDYMNKSILQPFVLIEAKGIEAQKAHVFKECLEREVRKLVEGGIDKQLIEGAIAHAEFVMREGDFGTSTGVILAVNALSAWLYDDAQAIDPLRYETTFATLREKLETDYFEKLLAEVLLENDHRAFVEVVPTAKESSEEAERLAAIKQTLDTAQLEAIMAEAEELHRIQMEPDSPEALATLPLLELSDIAQTPAEPEWHFEAGTPLPSIIHEVPTHGIDYLSYYFSLDHVTYDELPYVTLLANLLGKLDTEHYTASEIDTLSQLYLGRLRFSATTYENETLAQGIAPKFIVSASVLSKNLDHASCCRKRSGRTRASTIPSASRPSCCSSAFPWSRISRPWVTRARWRVLPPVSRPQVSCSISSLASISISSCAICSRTSMNVRRASSRSSKRWRSACSPTMWS